MRYRLEMSEEQAALLVRVVTDKVKEVHAWIAATGSHDRDDEYHGLQDLLKNIHTKKQV